RKTVRPDLGHPREVRDLSIAKDEAQRLLPLVDIPIVDHRHSRRLFPLRAPARRLHKIETPMTQRHSATVAIVAGLFSVFPGFASCTAAPDANPGAEIPVVS